jgi:hypothetical protein
VRLAARNKSCLRYVDPHCLIPIRNRRKPLRLMYQPHYISGAISGRCKRKGTSNVSEKRTSSCNLTLDGIYATTARDLLLQKPGVSYSLPMIVDPVIWASRGPWICIRCSDITGVAVGSRRLLRHPNGSLSLLNASHWTRTNL